MSGKLAPERQEIIGLAEVRDVFKSPKFGAVAGCMVTEGVSNVPTAFAFCVTTWLSMKASWNPCAASRMTSTKFATVRMWYRGQELQRRA